MPAMKLTAFDTAAQTARTAARSGKPGAISTSAPAFSNAGRRAIVSSRLGGPVGAVSRVGGTMLADNQRTFMRTECYRGRGGPPPPAALSGLRGGGRGLLPLLALARGPSRASRGLLLLLRLALLLLLPLRTLHPLVQPHPCLFPP